MAHNLKTFGVALVAIIALTAAAVSVASAASFTASAYPTEATGESSLGNVTIKTEAGTFECSSHSIGLLAASSEVLTLATTLKCSYGFGVKIVMNGCNLTAAAPTGSADSYSATLGVACPTGQVIVVEIGGGENYCQFTIPSQANIGTVNITDDTIAGDIRVQYTASKMEYTVTFDKIGCPLGGVGTKNGGVLVHDSPETLRSTNAATIDVG